MKTMGFGPDVKVLIPVFIAGIALWIGAIVLKSQMVETTKEPSIEAHTNGLETTEYDEFISTLPKSQFGYTVEMKSNKIVGIYKVIHYTNLLFHADYSSNYLQENVKQTRPE